MKKFVLETLAFILLSCLLIAGIILIWGQNKPSFMVSNLVDRTKNYGHTSLRLKEVKHYQNIDILFVGSSHVYRGFDNRIFTKNNISSFNLGTPGQSPIQSKYLLNRYLKNLDPKLIIFDVFPSPIFSEGIESSIDVICNDSIGWDTFEMAAKINSIKTWNIFSFKYLMNLIGLNDTYNQPVKYKQDTYIKGGYVEKIDIPFQTNANKIYDFQIEDKTLSDYRLFLKKIEEQSNSQVILLFSPITKELYRSNPNYLKMDSIYRSWPFEYFNYNILDGIIDTLHFNDYHHMSQKGVEYFNPIFINDLKRLNLL